MDQSVGPQKGDGNADVVVSWWVVDDRAGGALEQVLDALVPQWVTTAWPFSRPRFHP